MYQIYADGKLLYQPGNERLRLTSPKLTVEMGKAGSLQFGLPPTNTYYNNLQQLKVLLTVTEDSDEIFRGRVLSNKRNFNNVRDIYGEGDLSYLVDSVQQPKKYKGKAHELFTKIIAAHNENIQDPIKQFTVGNITVDNRDVYIPGKDENIDSLETNKFDYNQIVINSEVDNWQTSFDFIEQGLIDYAGGYMRTRYVASEGKTYIDWLKDFYSTSSQTIAFGKNMLDLTEENNAEEAFSVLIPIGDENLTIKKASDGISEDGLIEKKGNELIYKPALEKYGRIVKTNVFDGVNKASTLKENGERYIREHAIPSITFTITAVDLHVLNPSVQSIRLGDKVHVLSAPHEIDDPDLICTKIEYDLSNPANTRYTFGKPKQDLTERYRKDKKKDTGRGGGGGAAKQAGENAGSALADSYKDWVKYDPNDRVAQVDIGALFERTYPKGGQLTSGTQILMNSDSGTSKIDLISKFNDDLDNISNQAGVDIVAGAGGSEVVIFADNNGKRAEIKVGKLNTDVVIGHKPDGTEIYETKSSMAFKADITKLETETLDIIASESFTLSTKIATIDAELTNITGALHVGDVVKCDMSFHAPGANISETFVYQNHEVSLHSHEVSESNGVIKIGQATWDTNQSFNMADTRFYKEHVSASLDYKFDKSNIGIQVWSNNAYGTKVLSKSFTNEYQPKTVTIDYEISESGKAYKLTATVKNKNGTVITSPTNTGWGTTYTTSALYNKGFNATRVDHVSRDGDYVRVYLTNGNQSRHEL